MPTMLVEIAARRCPPASGMLLASGCASMIATPAPTGLARPHRSVVSFLLPGLWGARTSQTSRGRAYRRRARAVNRPLIGTVGDSEDGRDCEGHCARRSRVLASGAQRFHARGHRLRLGLRLRARSELAVTRWPPFGSDPLERPALHKGGVAPLRGG